MRLLAILTVLACLLLPRAATAHPHVWIETRANFVFDQGRMTGVDLDWLFDEMFSAAMVEDFDHGHKGHFDAKDIADLQQQVLPGYADFAYYTHIRIDGQEVKIGKTDNFTASLEKGQVRFKFRALLPEPVDPAKHKIEAGLYDETFFVDLGLAADKPIGFTGTDKCTATIAEDPAHKIYFGQVVPEVIRIACSK
jgi:ABC-type uncharacterized transport system substrate-binding protein